MHMLLATYSILPAVLKWGPANGVVYTFAKMCIRSIFSCLAVKNLLQLLKSLTCEDALAKRISYDIRIYTP